MNTQQINMQANNRSSVSSSSLGRLRRVLAAVALVLALTPLASSALYMAQSGGHLGVGSPVYAAVPVGCPGSNVAGPPSAPCPAAPAAGAPAVAGADGKCPNGNTLPPGSPCVSAGPVPSTCPKGDCIITKYIDPAVNTVSALVGVAVTISIIYGGIQYASSADSSQKVSEAKQRIVKSIFVLLGYFFFYAFLNYVIPGGLV